MDIAAELADVATFGGFFEIDTDPSGPGWRPMSTDLDVRIETTAASLRDWFDCSDMRIAASLTQLNVAARLLSPTLALAVRHGLVPVLSLDDLRWQPTSTSMPLGLENPRGVTASVAAIDEHVLQAAVEPLVVAVGEAVRISPKVLWGNVGSALGGAVTVIGQADPEAGRRARELVELLLAETPRAGTGSYENDRFRRRSCCLYYRVAAAAGYCGDCVLT